MELLISILMFLGFLMPNTQYTPGQVNDMILMHQHEIQTVQQDPYLTNQAVKTNGEASHQIIEEWPDDPEQPILK